ncbi:MAG: HAD family hydrolase [Verrucomicrobiales bacterium]|nr:HAD family hydrolase [Verrucomicrobiales bacterium]
MKVEVVIFDVYGTLLDVGPVPDALEREARWVALWDEVFGGAPPRAYAQVVQDLERVIARHHAWAIERGVANPEVCWPEVVVEAVPETSGLRREDELEFAAKLAGIPRVLRLMPGSAVVLRGLRERGVRLGIASNAQAYTWTELETALRSEALSLADFDRGFCFWSFESGFSKPNPHVFQWLTARLAGAGVEPGAVLMVGDREDNDVQPARAFGWQTWRIADRPGLDWESLGHWLFDKGNLS